jgi:predicted small secreted protein
MLKKVALSVTLLLVIGSWVLAGCGGSEPAGLGEGRGMLYFYATW